eukprot:jgi/Botrbrau1/20862/Bobra.0803s0002.1
MRSLRGSLAIYQCQLGGQAEDRSEGFLSALHIDDGKRKMGASYCGPYILPKAPLTDHLHTHACIQRVLPRHTNTLLTCIHVHGISGSDTDHICNQNSHPNL